MPFQPSAGGPPPGASVPPAAAPSDPWGSPASGPTVTAGTLISRTFKVWWANVGKLVAMMVLLMIPIVVVFAVAGFSMAMIWGGGFQPGAGAAPPVPSPSAVAALGALVVLVVLPATVIVFGGITYGVFRWLGGLPAGVGAMLAQGARRFLGLVVAALLLYLAVLGASLFLLVPGVMLGTAACVVLPAVVVERVGPIAAFRRSFELTRGFRWSLFGAFVVVMLANFGASLAGNALALVPFVGPVLSMAVSIVFGTIPYVIPAVAYHDLRLLKEGVDTSRLVAVFE